jgi:hypothetical protein
VAAALAAGIEANRSPWRASDIVASAGTIEFVGGSPALNTPALARLNATVSGTALSALNAQIIWDIMGEEPAFGQDFPFTIRTVGERKLEAEAVLPDGRRIFGVKTFSVHDPINGGTEFPDPTDYNVVALYHFNSINQDGTFPDSSLNGYHLTKSGNVVLADNTTWMKNPSGKVVRFTNYRDELYVTIPSEKILPWNLEMPPPVPPVLKIEFRIYPRAYKSPLKEGFSRCALNVADIFTLRQSGDTQWRIVCSDDESIPHVQGPYEDNDPPPQG